jgi:hypothetical protein
VEVDEAVVRTAAGEVAPSRSFAAREFSCRP